MSNFQKQKPFISHSLLGTLVLFPISNNESEMVYITGLNSDPISTADLRNTSNESTTNSQSFRGKISATIFWS